MFQRADAVLHRLEVDGHITVSSKCEDLPSSRRRASNVPAEVCTIGSKNIANEDLNSSSILKWADLKDRPIWEVASEIRNWKFDDKVLVLTGRPSSGKTMGGLHILASPWYGYQCYVLVSLPTTTQVDGVSNGCRQLQISKRGHDHTSSVTGASGWKISKGKEIIRFATIKLALSMLNEYKSGDVLFLDEWDYPDAEFLVLKTISTWRALKQRNLYVYGASALPIVDEAQNGVVEEHVEFLNVSSVGHRRLDIEIILDRKMRNEIIGKLAEVVDLGHCVLVFLPGEGEIKELALMFTDDSFQVICLYRNSDTKCTDMERILEPVPVDRRRIIISTDIIGRAATIYGVQMVLIWPFRTDPVFQGGIGSTVVRAMPPTSMGNFKGRAGREEDGITIVIRPSEEKDHSCHEPFGQITLQASEAPSFVLTVEKALRQAGCDLLSAVEFCPHAVVLFDTTWPLVLRKLQCEGCLYRVFTEQVQHDTLPGGPASATDDVTEIEKQAPATEFGTVTDYGSLIVELPINSDLAHILVKAMAADHLKDNQAREIFTLAVSLVTLLHLQRANDIPHVKLQGVTLQEVVDSAKKQTPKCIFEKLMDKLWNHKPTIEDYCAQLSDVQLRSLAECCGLYFKSSSTTTPEESYVAALLAANCPFLLAMPCPLLGSEMYVSLTGVLYRFRVEEKSPILLLQSKSEYGATRKSLGKVSIWERDIVQSNIQYALHGCLKNDVTDDHYEQAEGPWCLIFMDSISDIQYKNNRQTLSSEICQIVGKKVAWPVPIIRGGQTFAECAAWLYRLTTTSNGNFQIVDVMVVWLNFNEVFFPRIDTLV